MTFQRTTLTIARLIRHRSAPTRIVVGGYDPSLAPQPHEASSDVDFLVRGEGEHTLSELLRALEGHGDKQTIAGLSYRLPGIYSNPDRAVQCACIRPLQLPNRAARVLQGYTLLGRPVDVVETSRGCTFRLLVLPDHRNARPEFPSLPGGTRWPTSRTPEAASARAIFLVDDNITLDVQRFEAICRAIAESGFNDVDYTVQAMTAPIAQHGARLAPLMRKAGLRYVFLGIENVLDTDLDFLKARAKNARRERGRTIGNATIEAIEHLHRNGMFIVGGLIVGNPDDTRESIEANLAFARRYIDWPYIQHPTPYPRTPMTREFRERNLIVDEDVSHYDGTTAVVRSEHVAASEIEFMRWRSERWMKVRHMPSVFVHSPRLVLRHGHEMLANTFTGTSVRSVLGLESDRAVFDRFRQSRRRDREHLALNLQAHCQASHQAA